LADPMYQQIAEDLRRQIEDGELAPGSQLLTELELREKYKASRNTIRDAIKALITRGLVETRPGQGTFVVAKIIPFVTTLSEPDTGGSGEVGVYEEEREAVSRREARASRVRVEIQDASEKVANDLRIPEGTTVVSRHQKRFIDETPWSMQTSFYPMSHVDKGARLLLEARNIDQGTMAYLHETLAIDQAGWRDVVTVRAPDEDETAFFNVPSDGRVAVIETTRTAYDQNTSPVRTTVTVYPADRNQFVIISGKVPHDLGGQAGQTEVGTSRESTESNKAVQKP
jgi:GntR family transcriptional regulator